MGAIYTHSLVSGWNSLNTYTSFFGSALVIGPVLAVSMVVPMLRDEINEKLVKTLVKYSFYLSIFGIAVQLVGLAVFATSLPEVNMMGGTSAFMILEGVQSTVAIRWIIEIIGVGILGYLALSNNRKIMTSFTLTALLVLVVAEGMSRYLFYLLGA